ncbi:MAG: hypothetical protein IJP03_06510 [Christensenellaceae bacterium]|nr:hypothetical protein [Christensenellaceae bacterium]
MVKIIWGGLLAGGVLLALFTGRAEALSLAMVESAGDSAQLCLSMLGIYCLWMGLLKVAEEGGLIRLIARASRGLICRLFRGLHKGSEAVSLITLNLVANMLGMGNAATPFGLRAMAALQRANPNKAVASDDMCMFIIVNTASVQLLPLTVIALRGAAGSASPGEIIPTAFLATLATAVIGIVGAKLCAKRGRP